MSNRGSRVRNIRSYQRSRSINQSTALSSGTLLGRGEGRAQHRPGQSKGNIDTTLKLQQGQGTPGCTQGRLMEEQWHLALHPCRGATSLLLPSTPLSIPAGMPPASSCPPSPSCSCPVSTCTAPLSQPWALFSPSDHSCHLCPSAPLQDMEFCID